MVSAGGSSDGLASYKRQEQGTLFFFPPHVHISERVLTITCIQVVVMLHYSLSFLIPQVDLNPSFPSLSFLCADCTFEFLCSPLFILNASFSISPCFFSQTHRRKV